MHSSPARRMRRARALTAAAALLTVTLTAALTGPTPSAAAQPAGAPGDVVSAQPIRFMPNPVTPSNAKAWKILYRSTSATGQPNVVSGTVLVPDDGRTGPRPLVTYAVGTVGIAPQCVPSAGFPTGTTAEGTLINQALLRGWAVAVTDYELVGSPGVETYTVGRAEGQAVLDAARAAERLPGTGLDASSPVGIMGYSQGGQASSWAAELHSSYAPDLNVKGTATGGVPADLLKVADYNNGGIGAGLILMAAIGHDTAYPQLDLAKYLNAESRAYVAFDKTQCVGEDAVAEAFKSIDQVTVTNPLYQPDWLRALRADQLGTRAPDAPVYLYQATADELIPYAVGAQLRSDWCAKGADVQWQALPLLGHVEGAIVGSPPAMNWLADRFASEPTNGNC
ncbi:lipase family protein [Streptomyces sp. RB6PN25]|uniref:Lipase family protein n=1 Tax=Streptomyces humicola TaxID=2953240 RepID=A0ABT1PUA0_9ACTN|nr:lipase family protein [Streptomyces humicola]MCQ4081249.1 lipase family protein [Streptomyces humicola]